MKADRLTIPEQLAQSESLVKKYLTGEIYQHLKDCKTSSGFTLDQALASGIKNQDSLVGFYAGDEHTYQVFSPLLDPIIEDYHQHSVHDMAPDFHPPDLHDPDPDRRFILSTRIRLARNLKHFNFPCHITLKERQILEDKIIAALNSLPDHPKGSYYSFEKTDTALLAQLEKEKLSFPKGDRFQDSAGCNTDFPKCRGVYHSNDKKLNIWVNEEDHLRIISMEKSADLKKIFARLCKLVDALSDQLEFAHHPTRGFLTSCPTNIGTTMRAGVHIRLPKLEQDRPLLDRLTRQHHLQIRGTAGEKTTVQQAVFDISNHRRMGLKESDIIKNLHAGLITIIDAEKSL